MLLALLTLGLAATTFAQGFVGSQTCKTCHVEIFGRWSKTRMANVIQDPKVHPEAILPDLSKPNPLVTFKKEDIAFTYGSKWKQRYFQKVGDDYFPLGAQWDVTNQVWRAYQVAANTDWWTVHYPGGNATRPTGPLCDGCHSVNYNIQTKQVTEWNVGCEKCHGPGEAHAKAPARANIVNPARLDFVAANDTCIQCHSQGQPLVSPNAITGKYYDWPVGFQPGLALKDFWKLEEAKLGSTTFTHYADGTGHKNRMQGNDYVQSSMYSHGVTCSACHDVHGTANNAVLIKPASVLCQTCHGQRAEAHTGHKAGSKGSECIACHMPAIEATIANVNVRSHTFKFIPPSMTEAYKIPNPCTTCHTDKPLAWAKDALKKWPGTSPWRVAN